MFISPMRMDFMSLLLLWVIINYDVWTNEMLRHTEIAPARAFRKVRQYWDNFARFHCFACCVQQIIIEKITMDHKHWDYVDFS